jgi:hypothetical protein
MAHLFTAPQQMINGCRAGKKSQRYEGTNNQDPDRLLDNTPEPVSLPVDTEYWHFAEMLQISLQDTASHLPPSLHHPH